MDSLALSQSFIGASITLTGRGGTSRHLKAEDIEDMDELPDSLVDKMYNEIVDKDTESHEATERPKDTTTKTGANQRKRKTIAPAASATARQSVQPTQKKYAPNITTVGKKAKSRLFHYESENRSASTIGKQAAGRNLDDNERHELRKQETLRQVRLAAEEKKRELNQHLRESLSRERTANLQSQALAGKGAMKQQIQAEHRLRKEI